MDDNKNPLLMPHFKALLAEYDKLRAEIAALRAEVQRLSISSTRLGPQPQTQAEIDAITQRIIIDTVERIKARAAKQRLSK